MDFGSKITEFLGVGGKPLNPTKSDDAYAIPVVEEHFKDKIQRIDQGKWNQVYKYYFRLAKADSQGRATVEDPKVKGFNKYTQHLHIPPQAISIQTHFASSVVATNRGVLEENNGVTFRTITISGTTGVWPTKPYQGMKNLSTASKLFNTIFPAAVTAIGGLVKSVQKTVASFVGGPADKVAEPGKDSGYYQFWALHNFLVACAEARKGEEGNDLRLIFGAPKDNIEYVVTPVQFEMRRDAGSALLYRYQIVLRAWDIVSDPQEPSVKFDIPTPDNVNAITSILNTLKDGRAVIQSVRNILKSVNSDLAGVLLVFNQANLVMKEIAGVGEDIGDFGDAFRTNAKYLLKGPDNTFFSSLQAYEASTGTSSPRLNFSTVDESQPLGNTSQVTPGGESTPLGSSRLALAQGVLDSALENPTFLQNPVTDFVIPPNVESQLETAREEARGLTSGDIRGLTDSLQRVSDNFAQNTGLMDPDYALIYGLPYTATDRLPTEDDILTNAAIQESKISLTTCLATGQIFRERDLDPFAIANENLDRDDQLETPLSALPIAFPRGRSLEDIAQQYLDDSSRWREIALLNGLRAPYIDEAGFDLPIFSANGRSFVVKDISHLTIYQPVLISGTMVASTQRRIINIEDIGGSQWRISVDGPDTLSDYVAMSSPKIHTRLPGCVGSGDTIFIPSSLTPDDPLPMRPNALYSRLSHAEKVFRIDLALDDSEARDLVVDHSGDVKRSSGYQNATQAIRIALETENGELERHPSYGVAVPVGGRNSGITTEQFEEIVASRVRADSRFLNAEVSASIEGSVARVRVVAQGAQGTGHIPVDFEIGKTS